MSRVLATPTGWYSMLRLGAVEAFGRHPESLQAFDVVAVVAVVVLTGWLARRWLGPAAIAPATLLLGGMPAVVVEGRQGWIHVPEAALVLGSAAVWAADTGLVRRRSMVGMVLLGGLAILLRPSGLVWVGSLTLLLWGAPWRRVAVVLAGWAVAAIVPLVSLPEYLAAKASARERYAIVIPELWPQFLVLMGPAVAAAVVLGIAAAGITLLRRRPPTAMTRGLFLAGAWVAIALLLAVVFRAGLDNHPLALVGLALGAAWGLAAAPRVGLGVAALAFAFQYAPQWAPLPAQDSVWWRVPGAWRIQVAPSILNYYVPFPRYGVPQVRGLLDAICGNAPCSVVVDQGLYLPYGEEPGLYELFAAGEGRPRLLAAHDLDPDKVPAVDALVAFDCPEQDGPWQVRWPDARATRERITQRQHLEEVWATEVGPGCVVRWSTPRRFVAHPESLPRMR